MTVCVCVYVRVCVHLGVCACERCMCCLFRYMSGTDAMRKSEGSSLSCYEYVLLCAVANCHYFKTCNNIMHILFVECLKACPFTCV